MTKRPVLSHTAWILLLSLMSWPRPTDSGTIPVFLLDLVSFFRPICSCVLALLVLPSLKTVTASPPLHLQLTLFPYIEKLGRVGMQIVRLQDVSTSLWIWRQTD